MGKSGGKGISYFGLVAMGIGCMLGTSWLLLTGTWLETAGGPLNLVVAFALCIIIELPPLSAAGGASPWGGRAS